MAKKLSYKISPSGINTKYNAINSLYEKLNTRLEKYAEVEEFLNKLDKYIKEGKDPEYRHTDFITYTDVIKEILAPEGDLSPINRKKLSKNLETLNERIETIKNHLPVNNQKVDNEGILKKFSKAKELIKKWKETIKKDTEGQNILTINLIKFRKKVNEALEVLEN